VQTEPRTKATEGSGEEPGPFGAPAVLVTRSGAARKAGRAAIVVALAVGLFGAGGIGLVRVIHPAPAPTSPPAVVGGVGTLAGAPALAVDPLSGNIQALQDRLRTSPSDVEAWAELGFDYVQEARVTADPSYYPKAEAALRRSLSLRTDANYVALAGMGALSAARHDFAGALSWGRKAQDANPDNAQILGILTDAEVELGRYQQAFTTLQRMVDMRPDTSSYARVSYARELQGDSTGAIFNMRLALRSAGTPADRAWASYYLGELFFNQGDLDQADQQYRMGRAFDPAFVPNMEGLAKVEAARGDTDAAIADYMTVVQQYPLPQYVIELGDLYTVSGRPALAAQQYDLVHAEQQLFRSNGVNIDIDIALFNADHGTDLAAGLAAARAEWGRRKSILVADALAWSLHANGLDGEALAYSDRSLALGTNNALLYFHRAMIERALGGTGAARADLARAIGINPNFSILWSRTAADTLRALGGAP
jgi:tetratricopeptide (TPR) repeat protein